MRSETFVSVVVTVEQPMPTLVDQIKAIQQLLDTRFSDYEILLVVQGPVRRHVPDAQASAILATVPCVRMIQLASAVAHDVARAAGFENAIGDFVLLFDPEQDPPQVIIDAVDICRRGSDVVVGVSRARPSLQYRIARRAVSRLLSAIDYQIPPNATDFRCVSRRAINAVIETGRFYQQLNLRLQKTGYPSEVMLYEPLPNAAPRRSLFKASRSFLRLLVFNSSKPLRWMSGLGLIGSGFAFTFAVYSVAIRLVRHGVVQGWTTTILFMSVQFMLMFIILAFISEYIGRMLEEQRGAADYAVVYEKNSTVMVNADRVNVLADSIAPDQVAS